MIHVCDLPEQPAAGVQLYCYRCQEEFSAAKGDYFLLPSNHAFVCQSCKRPLMLVEKRTTHRLIIE
jgi:hypothetical protein